MILTDGFLVKKKSKKLTIFHHGQLDIDLIREKGVKILQKD
jgi:hypothetical protein